MNETTINNEMRHSITTTAAITTTRAIREGHLRVEKIIDKKVFSRRMILSVKINPFN